MTTTHKLTAKIAKDLAGEYYEMTASTSDEWYKQFPNVKQFIKKEWPVFLAAAREIMVDILASDAHENVKRPIYHALMHERGIENGVLVREDALH